MHKPTLLLFILLVVTFNFSVSAQQKKGKYIPTKYDSVKKVIPEQYYGKASEAKKKDSLAKVEADQKQQELKAQEKKQQEKAEMQLLELKQKQLQEKKRQEQLNRNKNTNKPVEKSPVISKPQIIKPREIPANKKVNSKPEIALKKPAPQKQTLQKSVWTLAECIEYAKQNNLQAVAAELDERYAQLLTDESKNSRYPDLNGDIRIGKSFGRNIDPATNQFVDRNFNYHTAGLYSQTLLFGWFQKKYQIEKNELDAAAAHFETDQLKSDLSLNIATGFMRVLMARSFVKMTEQDLKITATHAENMSRNASNDQVLKMQLNSMLASDSALYLEARANEKIALLELKALMNFDFKQDFDIQTTISDGDQVAQYFSLPDAETLYDNALLANGKVSYQQLLLMSAKKSLDVNKAMQLPKLSLFGGLGTVYSSNIKDITSQTYEGESSVGSVNINGSSYPVTSSVYNYSTDTRSAGSQYRDHVRAQVGLAITIPLLNGYASRANIQKANIALVRQQLIIDNQNLQLRKDIYKTYEEAKAASQKYISYTKASDESARLLDAMGKKLSTERGSLSDVSQAMNIHTQNQIKALQARYDLFLKLKMLDYFTGNPLKM